MYLRLFASRPKWGQGALWFSVVLLAGSCRISQPTDTAPDACPIGDLCGDAGSSEAVGTMPVAPATVITTSSRPDAAAPPIGLCPGECLPDDPAAKECAEPVVIELQFASQHVMDGGLDLDAGMSSTDEYLDASVSGSSASSSTLDAAPVDAATEAGTTDGSTPLMGDASSRPLDVVDQTSGGKDTDSKPLSCQLVSVNGAATAGCAPSGQGVEGSVCTSARDCAAGFGCVGEVGAGQCLPYCCGGNDVCGVNRYCDSRKMRSLEFDESPDSAPDVPVCVAAEQCSLDLATDDDPADARGEEVKSCPEKTACTIVRADTTACRPTGLGKEGDACPCSGGFFCSQVTNTCLELCNTNEPSSCGERECQPGPSGFPDGWGLCVGG